MSRVRLSRQVAEFLASLPPDPRKRLRHALHLLEKEVGDIKALEGPLSSYLRLRSGSYRVILRRRLEAGQAIFDCLFAERRSLVYEVFSRLLAHRKSE